MAIIGRNLIVLSLAALCVCGCGTASTGKNSWAYSGPDVKLSSLPRISAGKMPPEVRRQKFLESMEAWEQQRQEALEASKDACARKTGDSQTPGFWRGYSDAFMACMKAQGWSRVSNPL